MIPTTCLGSRARPLLAAWLVLAGATAAFGVPAVRLNCGGGRADGSWRADPAATAGVRLQTTADITGCGQYPLSVYQSCRVGRRVSYSFPDLPDGVYRVRFHFAEIELKGRGERLFKLSLEKAVVVPVLDVVDRASGRFKALRLAFLVTVSDGNGLQVALAGLKGSQALLSGLEVIPVSPEGMGFIPAGAFAMGDSPGDGEGDERPVHRVAVGSFFMDQTEVTQALWNTVYGWALTHGYMFSGAYAKGRNHPVQAVDWDDCVKWCNARSEREGRLPAYYTDASLTSVYRSSRIDLQNGWVRWDEGYRLPTEAEWEKAARGGAERHRFPWSDAETIQHARANYYSGYEAYDTSPTRQYHPAFDDGSAPLTAPAGRFAPNGYGLYDMAGNVWEWCWDWYGETYYGRTPQADPRGPETGARRVLRGGGWNSEARFCRASFRNGSWPEGRDGGVGFRTVLPAP